MIIAQFYISISAAWVNYVHVCHAMEPYKKHLMKPTIPQNHVEPIEPCNGIRNLSNP